ncbi:MAG TPA: hypothetical protein DCW90_20650 [Lachnospiraceae bacterium]|nr:hypothetical protein [uncultured Lachnoclostridium sp.]HAU87804.1 hypothetical protein [Lachnospiraceae bacterium]
MDTNIRKIYEMMYSPILTPYNLLENAKIDNYSYVKYYKGEDGLICEMQCDMQEEGIKVFYYHFDSKDFLQSIYMESNNTREKVFDRTIEINKAKECYFIERETNKELVG